MKRPAEQTVDYLFVYGSLRPALAHPLQHCLRQYALWVGTGQCRGQLYDLGRYPGAVPAAKANQRLIGDVFRLRKPSPLLDILDRYEGATLRTGKRREYCRQLIEVSLEHRQLLAWIYLYNRTVTGKKRILSGDYLTHSRLPRGRRYIT